MMHVWIHPLWPEENGLVERCNRTLLEAFEDATMEDWKTAQNIIWRVIRWYNQEIYHRAFGYIRPLDFTWENSKASGGKKTQVGCSKAPKKRNQPWHRAENTGPGSTSVSIVKTGFVYLFLCTFVPLRMKYYIFLVTQTPSNVFIRIRCDCFLDSNSIALSSRFIGSYIPPNYYP